jgi:hypothetical protein
MSVHTRVKAKIHKAGDLTSILTAGGIPWRRVQLFQKVAPYREFYFAVEAVIGNERVWISQYRAGDVFVFDSERARFKSEANRRAVDELASVGPQADWAQIRRDARRVEEEVEQRRQEEVARKRREAEQQARAKEQRKREELERKAHAAEERLLAVEGARLAEVAREQEVERLRQQAEEQRQRDLNQQAAAVLSALSARQAAMAAASHGSNNPEADSSETDPSAALTAEVERIHQSFARAKVMESLDDLKSFYGLYLHSEQVSDDQTIEITLRG